MKTKKMLSLALALVMVVSCFAGFGTFAMAEDAKDAEEPTMAAERTGTTVKLAPLDTVPVDMSKDSEREPYDIGVMFVDMANEYFVNTAAGAEARCAERNCKYTITSSNTTSSEYIRLIENYINQQKDAVIVTYYSAAPTEDVSKACMEAGIPLIGYCFGNDNHTSEVVSDNYSDGAKIAAMAAEYISEHLGDKEEIKVAFGTISTVESMAVRCKGMVETFMELVPNAVDVGIEKSLDSTAKAYDWAEEVLLAEPDVDVFVCFCDAIAIGAAEALKDQGKTGDECAVFGMDGSDSALSCIAEENGTFKGTVYYDTYAMGEALVDIAIAVLDGEEVSPEYEYITPIIITPENVAEYYKG